MTDMESKYGIDTINHSHTTKAIRDLNGVSGYKVEYGLTFLTYDPFIRISNPRKESKTAKTNLVYPKSRLFTYQG